MLCLRAIAASERLARLSRFTHLEVPKTRPHIKHPLGQNRAHGHHWSVSSPCVPPSPDTTLDPASCHVSHRARIGGHGRQVTSHRFARRRSRAVVQLRVEVVQ